jgi:hypothetical protein
MAPRDPTKRRGILGTRIGDWNGDRDVLYLRMREDVWTLTEEAKAWFGAVKEDEDDLVTIFRSAESRAERRAKRAARRIGKAGQMERRRWISGRRHREGVEWSK